MSEALFSLFFDLTLVLSSFIGKVWRFLLEDPVRIFWLTWGIITVFMLNELFVEPFCKRRYIAYTISQLLIWLIMKPFFATSFLGNYGWGLILLWAVLLPLITSLLLKKFSSQGGMMESL